MGNDNLVMKLIFSVYTWFLFDRALSIR